MKKEKLIGGLLFCVAAAASLQAQWARTYGGKENDRAWSVIQASDGTFVVAGTTKSFGMGNKDMWILKLSSEGKVLWQRTCGDSLREGLADDEALSVQTTRDGRYILAGTKGGYEGSSFFPDAAYLKVTKTGDIQWKKGFGNIGFGDPELSRSYPLYFGTNPRVFAVKLDGQGERKFVKAYLNNYQCAASAVRPTPDLGFLVAGKIKFEQASDKDFLLMKISSWGDLVWQYVYGGARVDEANALALTADGGCVLAGPTASYGAGGYDAWILKLDAAGKIQWQKAYGGPKDDYAHAIQKTRDGGYAGALLEPRRPRS